MEENWEPTNEQLAAMAQAACDAAGDKAQELGVNRIAGMILGIERAYNATLRTVELMNAIGFEAAVALGNALRKSEMYDMMKEAEEAINGTE